MGGGRKSVSEVSMRGLDEEGGTSNYHELRNLVDSLEETEIKGTLKDRDIFLFTNSQVAEGIIYKGTYSVRPLFNLI